MRLARALPQSICAMHMSNFLIIYMAIAAPHGVAFFLQQDSGRSLSRRLTDASGATLLWPLVWIRRAVKKAGSRLGFPAEDQTTNDAHFTATEGAARKLLAAFDDADESLRSIKMESSELAIYEFRELLEKYVGLTRIAAANSISPSAREMETARLSGRRGDDLFLAGLCAHRRNNARLAAHLDSARAGFLQALTELRRRAPDALSLSLADGVKKRDLFKRILRVYACAIDLASLLEDRATARRIEPLLDAECALLRALEACPTRDASTLPSHEEEICLTTHARHTPSMARLPNETLTQA